MIADFQLSAAFLNYNINTLFSNHSSKNMLSLCLLVVYFFLKYRPIRVKLFFKLFDEFILLLILFFKIHRKCNLRTRVSSKHQVSHFDNYTDHVLALIRANMEEVETS